MSYGDYVGRLAFTYGGIPDILYPTGSGASGDDSGLTTTVGESVFALDPNRKCIIHSLTYSGQTAGGSIMITSHLGGTFTWTFPCALDFPHTAELCIPIFKGGFKVQVVTQPSTFFLTYSMV